MRYARGCVSYHLAKCKAVHDGVGSHQGDSGSSVLKRQNSEMPAGPELGVDGEASPLVRPGIQIRPWPGCFGDVDVLWTPSEHPPIPRKGQRRPLDSAP